MYKFEENLASRVSGALQPMLGVQVTVTASNGLLATLYADDESTVLANPVTTDANGYFGFKAANGEYTLTFAGAQIETSKRNIELYDADDDPPLTLAQAAGVSGNERIGGTWFGNAVATLAQMGTSIGSTLIGHGDKSIGTVIGEILDLITSNLPDNASLVAAAAAKIKTGNAKIVCLGDSMTYGHDTVSGDKVAPVAPHVQWRTPVPYPAKLQASLNSIFSSTGITIENRGFSGDTVKMSYERWTTNPDANLVFVMFGINDSAPEAPGLSLADYVRYLTRTVLRYNAWGCGVVVMTSTSLLQGNEFRDVDAYRAAAIEVADRLGCPVFHADLVGLNNKKDDIYSDGVHFNAAGYNLLGNSVAMFVAAGGLLRNANVVDSDLSILPGAAANIVTNGVYAHAEGSYSRQELILKLLKGTNHKATLAFFLDTDAADISMVGTIGLGTSVQIDLDSIRSVSTRKSNDGATTSGYTVSSDTYLLSAQNNQQLGQVVGRGWHCITIGATSNASTGENVLSALRVTPKTQAKASSLVRNIELRSFSIFDPAPTFGALPAASSLASFTLPMSLFGTLPHKGPHFYGSNFLIVEICNYTGSNVRSYTRCLVSPISSSAYAVTLLETVGANAVSLASVTGPAIETADANLVFALDRPAAGYIEMRFTVPDSASLRSAAQT